MNLPCLIPQRLHGSAPRPGQEPEPCTPGGELGRLYCRVQLKSWGLGYPLSSKPSPSRGCEDAVGSQAIAVKSKEGFESQAAILKSETSR